MGQLTRSVPNYGCFLGPVVALFPVFREIQTCGLDFITRTQTNNRLHDEGDIFRCST
jgi:hypothetical protein